MYYSQNYQTQQLINTIAPLIMMAMGVGMMKPVILPQRKIELTTERAIPTFKVRTIHYDNFNITFGPHDNEIMKGELSRLPEYGTSTSLDGAFLDYPCFTPGISLLFPLKPGVDLPKFYINPFGQYVSPTRRFMLDSPTFVRECEVKYPGILYMRNCLGVVFHVTHQRINIDVARRIEKAKEPSPGWSAERQAGYVRWAQDQMKYYAGYAHDILSYLEKHFRVLPEIPVTDFRVMTREITPKIKDYDKSPGSKESELRWREWFNNYVEVSRPYHEAVAKAYGLSYSDICSFAWGYIEGMLRK